MGKIQIQPGKTKDISQAGSSIYRVTVENGKIRVSDRRKNASSGDELVSGEQVTLRLEGGDGLFCYNPTDGTVTLNVNPQGLIIANRSTIIQRTAEKNFGDISSKTATSSSNGETLSLPDQKIPDGASLLIKPDSGNSGKVRLNDSNGPALGSGLNLTVSNFNVPDLYFESSGDTVRASAEVE